MNVLGYPDERRDALMRAALAPVDQAWDAWRQWIGSGADPATDAIAQRWLPLIAWNLRGAELDEPVHERLRDTQRGVWAWNQRVLEAARPAIEAFVAAGIPVVLLKGAALDATVYESPGLRPIGDVDVLVPPSEASRARAIAIRLGWTPLRPTGDRILRLRHAIDLHKAPHGALDLHWYLLHENCWDEADADMWRRCRPVAIAGMSVSVLDPADQLLHACVHGLRWSPVHSGHWIADAARIIGAHPDLDWPIVVHEAWRRGLGLQVLEALMCANRVAAVPVPDAALGALEALPVSRRDRLECRWKGRPVVSAGGMFVIWCGWRRAARASRRRVPWLGYLAAAVGVQSEWRLPQWFARHAGRRLAAPFRPGPRRGAPVPESLSVRRPS